ncbi:Ig-like domain-containing protein, partial [Vibrio sp. V11_P1A41T118]
AKAVLTAFTVGTNGQPANGSDQNSVTATVKDPNGNPISGKSVTFTVTGEATLLDNTVETNDEGEATAKITSLKAGKATITATYDGESKEVEVIFVADNTSAGLNNSNAGLVIGDNNSVADGIAKNSVVATLTDAQGNRVPEQSITFAVTNGTASLNSESITTDTDGKATVKITSQTAGKATITASFNGETKSVEVTFVADITTAALTGFTVDTNDQLANGSDANSVTATVKDAYGNPVVGQSVTFAVTGDASLSNSSVTTDIGGKAVVKIKSSRSGRKTITATFGADSKTVNVDFSVYAVLQKIEVTQNNAQSNGKDKNIVVATVVDGKGDPLPNYTVRFEASGSTNFPKFDQDIETDADGKAKVEITHFYKESIYMSASIDGKTEGIHTSFRLSEIKVGGLTFYAPESVHLSHSEAVNFCKSSGKRLPTPTEIRSIHGVKEVLIYRWDTSYWYWTDQADMAANIDFFVDIITLDVTPSTQTQGTRQVGYASCVD